LLIDKTNQVNLPRTNDEVHKISIDSSEVPQKQQNKEIIFQKSEMASSSPEIMILKRKEKRAHNP
jgi:hypothetical protein